MTISLSSSGLSVPSWRSPVRRCRFEVYLSWRFIRSNFPPTVLVGVVSTASAWQASDATSGRLPIALLWSLLYFWLFIYAHELPNQMFGAAEDATNKPHRPIPSGLSTPEGAKRRMLPVVLVYLAVAAAAGVLPWAALWLACVVGYHHFGWHRWWPGKAAYTVAGAVVIMVSSWTAGAGPLTPLAWTWIGAGGLYWTGVCALQDQRDVAGDKLVGRRTLPMVIGDRANRVAAAVFLVLLPASLVIPLTWWGRHTLAVLAFETAYTAVCWYLAWRALRLRTVSADDLTYKLYAALFCGLAFGPILL